MIVETLSVTVFISPFGIEFQINQRFEQGSLLKVHIKIPNYWDRKSKLVSYARIDPLKI